MSCNYAKIQFVLKVKAYRGNSPNQTLFKLSLAFIIGYKRIFTSIGTQYLTKDKIEQRQML